MFAETGGGVMTEYAWMSTAMGDPRHLRPFTNDFDGEDTSRLVSIQKRNRTGIPLSADDFPQAIWGSAKRGARTFGKLPNIFFGFGFWVVSDTCAGVLRQFDLGQGGLYPVKVFQKDKKTPIGDHDWFCLNFGNVKSGLVAEASNELSPRSEGKWSVSAIIEDDDVALSPSVLDGPDIWIDPKVMQAFFMSWRLGSALKKAKCTSGFGLFRCRVLVFLGADNS
jgi:hypothetical protein